MKVLIADDSSVSRRLLEATLVRWNYEVEVACDGEAAWESLQRADAPLLAILDWMMPGRTGLELCHLIRQKRQEPYTYIILLTSKGLKEDLIAGMEAGADDYLVKPFDQHELKVRLRAGHRILDLQRELVSAREALRIQATRDALTGLWNRRAILEILDRELARSQREGVWLGLVLADIDHFKTVNDTWGHAAGDAVLREAGRRMGAQIRPYDALARYGGEEFLLILPGCDEFGALAQAERLRLAFMADPFALPHGDAAVTASFGVTCVPPGLNIASEALIHSADEALYQAKRGGRNATCSLPCTPTLAGG
ncbi:MAG TPA: diguanylate cyclase response regulator [Solibacterales bacterium]|nr:diguanylate cyclase response regulator [Bryobacterales bacterium]